MNKIKTLRKKAQWSTMQKFVVAAVLIILLLLIVRSTIFGADTQLKDTRIAATNDYDSDGIKDNMDKSPCVFGEELVLVKGTKDVYYYITEAYKDGTTDYECPEGESPYQGKELVVKEDSESNKHVCVLSSIQCKELLKEEYERLRSEK